MKDTITLIRRRSGNPAISSNKRQIKARRPDRRKIPSHRHSDK